MQDRCTIVVLIDALGCELAQGFDAAGLGRRVRLRSVLGFSQAALTTILTGLRPQDHGLWMMYSFTEKGSPFSWLDRLPGNVSSRRLWVRRAIDWKLRNIDRVRAYYSLYDVPSSTLPHLDLPARHRMFGPGGAGAKSNIFDHFERRRTKWRVWDHTVDEAVAFDELEHCVSAADAEFYMLYTPRLDSIMHGNGTHSPLVEDRLLWYSERIERLLKIRPDSRMIVLGDHGMCDVSATVDLISIVDSLGPETCAGFIPFYDSTMARFRVLSERSGEELERLLAGIGGGSLMDKAVLRELGVCFPGGTFGDIIFLADPGTIIVPSFMSPEPVRAMHGYHPDASCMASVMLTNADVDGDRMDIADVTRFMVPDFEAGEAR